MASHWNILLLYRHCCDYHIFVATFDYSLRNSYHFWQIKGSWGIRIVADDLSWANWSNRDWCWSHFNKQDWSTFVWSIYSIKDTERKLRGIWEQSWRVLGSWEVEPGHISTHRRAAEHLPQCRNNFFLLRFCLSQRLMARRAKHLQTFHHNSFYTIWGSVPFGISRSLY